MRGKLTSLRAESTALRITPAGAGKTVPSVSRYLSGEDHPRRCGENNQQRIESIAAEGSPPQVRGKTTVAVATAAAARITPAGAGKTRRKALACILRQDHPRRCGENHTTLRTAGCRTGSPPQVRGKLDSNEPAAGLTGITPAGAGKTTRYIKQPDCRKDHPRRCGENRFVYRLVVHSSGSPPQVRGKPLHLCGCSHSHGITPAGAGKTCCKQQPNRSGQDHPRRCGENRRNAKSVCATLGSPPQVRGKLVFCHGRLGAAGITPAGAGKTSHATYSRRKVRDHPRRCGENHIPHRGVYSLSGSPPQVRGKRGYV